MSYIVSVIQMIVKGDFNFKYLCTKDSFSRVIDVFGYFFKEIFIQMCIMLNLRV